MAKVIGRRENENGETILTDRRKFNGIPSSEREALEQYRLATLADDENKTSEKEQAERKRERQHDKGEG